MKKIYLLFALLVSIQLIQAQYIVPCYTTEVVNHYETMHPGYKDKINQAFAQNKTLLDQMHRSRGVNDDTLYKIPVVVHIVYTSPTENLPDSLVYSQIQVLNWDYNRWNEDAVQTRDVFKPIAGSMHIEFYLATTDPSGNPTSGIIRKAGTPASTFLGFNAFQDNVKLAAEGDAAWNTDKYLNIWVCNLNTIPLGVLGYAYPPTGASNWPAGSETDSASQGVVIDYTAFGRNNPYVIDPGVVAGRTCVHETGHYLGLRHIWADEAACAEDDGIDDTPKAGDQTNFNCDTTKNTCVDVGIDYPDMIENYMDYSDERCQNMFTREQTDMMLLNLITLRPQLANKVVIGVGVNDLHGERYISIYPNPSSDFILIQFKSLLSMGTPISIFNSAGVKVREERITDETFKKQIDVRSFEPGIYYLQIANATENYRLKFSVY